MAAFVVTPLKRRVGVRLALEASPAARKVDDMAVVVGRDELTVGVKLSSAILVEVEEPNREELHQLTSKVLVRVGSIGRERLASHERQHLSHHRAVRHLADHVAQVAKGVTHEGVVVRHPRLHLVGLLNAHSIDHVNLRQCPCHTLSKLVGRTHRDGRPHHVLTVGSVILVLDELVVTILVHLVANDEDIELVPKRRHVGHLAR